MGLYNRFCKRFFAAVIIRLTAQSDSQAPSLRTRGKMGGRGEGGGHYEMTV